LRWSFYPAAERNLGNNLELMHGSCDLMTTDTVTTWFNVHGNRRRSLKHMSAKRALESLSIMDRWSIVLVHGNPLVSMYQGFYSCHAHLGQSFFTDKITGADKTPIVNWTISEMIIEDSITDKATPAAVAVSLSFSVIQIGDRFSDWDELVGWRIRILSL